MTQATSGRRLAFFGIAALAVLMSSTDATIVTVALPQLGESFGASLGWVGWVLTIYQLGQVIFMPVMGKLSDTLGRKRVFLACLALFTTGSLLAAFAPSVGWLIAFRALQAIGGGGMMPSAVGIVSDQFRDRRAQAIGLLTSIFPIGGIVGPALGGVVLEFSTWRALFMINVPIGLAILAITWFLLDDARAAKPKPLRVDLAGIALFAAAMMTLLFGMTELSGDTGLLHNRYLWALFAASAVLFGFFVRHIRRTANAVVDYQLLVRSPFWAANLYNFLFGAAAFGFASFVPYYAVVKFGMSPAASGAVVTPRAIAVMVVAALASLFIMRLGYRLPMIAGMLLIAGSMIVLGLGWETARIGGFQLDSFWLMASIVGIGGVGMGLAAPASNNAALDLAPRQSAELSGLRGMFRTTGGVLGIASVVLLLSFSPDKAAALDQAFIALAVVLLLAVPLTFVLPASARRGRREEPEAAAAPATGTLPSHLRLAERAAGGGQPER